MRITERTHVVDAMEAAADDHDSSELIGDCPYNARRLYDELRERDITAPTSFAVDSISQMETDVRRR